MTFSGTQVAGKIGSSSSSASSVTGGVKTAITRVAASSNVDAKSNTKSKDAKSQEGDNAVANEVTEIGKGEQKNSILNTDQSRLRLALGNLRDPGLYGLGIGASLPFGMSMPGGLYNPYTSSYSGGVGVAGKSSSSKEAWNGLGEANINPDYRGPDGGSDPSNNDPAPGGVIGNVDPLFKGGTTPKNITVLGASDSGSIAYGSGGSFIAHALADGITEGKNLGSILNELDGKLLNGSQTPHLTSTGGGLSPESSQVGRFNKATGTGIVMVGEDGSGRYHIGTEAGAQKIAASMRDIGLNVVFVRNEAEYKQAVIEADRNAKASGGKDILWVHGEAHGNSNRNGGGHSSDDIGFIHVGGGIDERNLIGHAAFAHASHRDVLFTTGACHSGAIDAKQTFEHIDRMFGMPVSNNPSEPKQIDQHTTSVDKSKLEPKSEKVDIQTAGLTKEEIKRKKELESESNVGTKLQVEIS